MLPLLFSLEVESSQSAQVLLAHRLIDGGTASNSLSIVVGRVGPPIGLGFDVAKDHVLNGSG